MWAWLRCACMYGHARELIKFNSMAVRDRSETTCMADVIVIDSSSEELEDSDCGIAKPENVKVVSVFDRRYTDCMIL